jgi:hypothetical protein
MPTFQRLLQKHPDAEMKWFARGRLWSSPEEARSARERHDRPPSGREGARARDDRAGLRERSGRGDRAETGRDRGWRPGGDHRDPKQKYADAKQARNAAKRKRRFDRKHGPAPARPREDARGPSDRRGSTRPQWHSGPPRGDSTRDASSANRGGPNRDRRDRPHGQTGGWSAKQDRRGPPHEQRGGTSTQHRPARPHGGGWTSTKERPRAPHGQPRQERPGRHEQPGTWTEKHASPGRPHGKPSGGSSFGRREHGVPGHWRAGGRKPGPRPDHHRGDGKRPSGRGSLPQQPHETEEPPQPRRPSPTHEPRPSENPPPTPPPRPSEPTIVPPGPPERGRGKRPRRS